MDEKKQQSKADIKSALAGVKRIKEIVDVGGAFIELRELSFAERNDIIRKHQQFADRKDGKAKLKREGIPPTEWVNLGLLVACAYVPGTEEKLWTRSEIPSLLELPSSLMQDIQRALFRVQGITDAVEEDDDWSLDDPLPDADEDMEIDEVGNY